MLKYLNCQVTFAEVPDEISLCINISNCPNHCPGCHSPELWQDIGELLTKSVIEDLLVSNRGITCVCFMGGDSEPLEVNELSKWIHQNHNIKTAWYSGRDDKPDFELDFDYVKLGSYKEECGPINIKTTNQRMYEFNPVYSNYSILGKSWRDITYKFWKNDTDS
jgi:anaerobic ribonucleoside-triphosphate reductase activating protein